MDLEDAGNGLFRDRREGYDLGETAQEFRTEIVLHDVHQIVVLRDLALVERIDDELATNVGGEQNQCVGEVAYTAQTVVQLTFVQDLQEEVEDRLVRFLDLVKQHNGIRLLADLVDQQTSLFVSNISRRRTVEQCHRVLFLELRHVETNQG